MTWLLEPGLYILQHIHLKISYSKINEHILFSETRDESHKVNIHSKEM